MEEEEEGLKISMINLKKLAEKRDQLPHNSMRNSIEFTQV